MFQRYFPYFLSFALPCALAAEHKVSSAADISRITPDLRPGDTLVMSDGVWSDQQISFKAAGTELAPITLRAESPGKVTLEGASSLSIEGEHLLVEGIWIKGAKGDKEAIAVRGDHCRVTACSVTDATHRNYLRLWGEGSRVDHCHFSGKTTDAPTVQIEVEDKPNHHRLDYNHFGHRPPLHRNGGETIRIGYSHQSMRSSATIVERNLFDRCDGELEIISNKSCDNVYRANTFRECAGTLTLRHGNRCTVTGNFFLGNLKRGSGGIRVIGEDHVVVNNYIDSVSDGALRITAGIPDSPLDGYFEAKNCTIAFNTIVASPGSCIDLDAGMGSSRRTLPPENIQFAYNVFSLPADGKLAKGREGAGYRWAGNFSNKGDDRLRKADLMLSRGKDGLWRPSAGSPVRSAAASYPGLSTDIDGQPRTGKLDAGCDQLSSAPATSRPMTSSDTGPPWMQASGGKVSVEDILRHDRTRILAAADAALKIQALTITSARAKLSEGGPNDFYSNGDYWWPDPEKPDGLPYIKRDGETNPENFVAHRDAIRDLRDAVAALAAASLLSNDDQYVAKAAELLEVFFLNPSTRMNPHLDYAQAIPGITSGRGIGIIDTLHLIEIPKAVQTLEKSGAFPEEVGEGVKEWFRDYLEWMLESKNGKEEAATRNNHAVAYFLQVAVFAHFTGNGEVLAGCRKRFEEVFVPAQMAGDGSFPQELARTKPYAYSIFQLDNMATLCQVLSTPEDDLWAFTTEDGRGMRKAMDYLYPFLADKSKWPLKPDVQAWEGWPARQPSLLFAGIAQGDESFVTLWKRSKPDPQDAEVRRNIAITQPALWLAR